MKFRHLIASILICCMMFLAACSNKASTREPSPENVVSNATDDSTTEAMNEFSSIGGVIYPESLINSDLPSLNWVVINDANIRMTEAVADEINKQLSELGCNFSVRFIYVNPNEEESEEPAPVQDVLDLINGVLNDKIDILTVQTDQRGMVNRHLADNDFYLPLNDYLNSEKGKSLKDYFSPTDKMLYRSTIHGTIYGIPWSYILPACPGIAVGEDIIDKYGFKTSDFKKDFSQLGDVFAEVYKKNGGQAFINMPSTYTERSLNNGSDLAYLGFLDLDSKYKMMTSAIGINYYNGFKVENIYGTDEMKNHFKVWQDYYKKGYTGSFEMSDSNIVSDSPCYSYTVGKIGKQYLIPATEKLMINDDKSSFALCAGIHKASDKTGLALELFSKIYSNKDLFTVMAYGIKEEDYTVDHNVAIPKENSYTNGYYFNGFVFGAEFSELTTPDSSFLLPAEDGKSKKETYLGSLARSTYCPYAEEQFDLSSVNAQVKATDQIMRDFYKGFSIKDNMDVAFSDLNEKLKNAGIDAIILEINRQIQELK